MGDSSMILLSILSHEKLFDLIKEGEEKKERDSVHPGKGHWYPEAHAVRQLERSDPMVIVAADSWAGSQFPGGAELPWTPYLRAMRVGGTVLCCTNL